MSNIEAVIFDLDGVITDTAEYHYQAWKALADELEISFDKEFNEGLKGIGRMESLEMILAHGQKELSDEEKERYAAKKNEHYQTFIEEITPNDLLPGVREFMEEIKADGIKTGLASASKNAQPVIERLEVTDLLDTVVNAAEVKKGKPDPEVFLKAAEQLGVNPEKCVGVEDAQAGVTAIKAANMFAVGVGSEDTLGEADWVVSDTSMLTLGELKRRFENKD